MDMDHGVKKVTEFEAEGMTTTKITHGNVRYSLFLNCKVLKIGEVSGQGIIVSIAMDKKEKW